MYRNSKRSILYPLLLTGCVAGALLLGHYLGRNSTASQLRGLLQTLNTPTNKISHTLSLIETQYVDPVPMDSLAEHILPE